MAVEDNKLAALLYFKHMHGGAVDQALAMMAPDALLSVTSDVPGGTTMTVDETRQGAAASFKVFAQPPVTTTTVIAAEHDRVCIEVVSRGGRTHGGTAYDNDYLIWLRFQDGLIAEFHEYFNPILAGPLIAELNASN